MPESDRQVDRLYQLPLDEFTAARNALAREAKQPSIKELEKPNVAAWAVNQLYWHHRPAYDRLVKAAERLRSAHRKLLAGKGSDLRETEQEHREAVRAAATVIKQLLADAGHAASDQTMHAVQETLEALPAAQAPGRLTRPLKPMGFEALADVTISPTAKPQLRIVTPASPSAGRPRDEEAVKRDVKRERELAKQREREERERKDRQRQAEKELKAAEAAMLRAEEAVKQAEKALSELRAKRDHAVNEYQRARLRAHE